jgi:hypothetical protein
MKYKLEEIKKVINNIGYSKDCSLVAGNTGFRIHEDNDNHFMYQDFMDNKCFILAGYSRNYNLNETDIPKTDTLNELKEIIEEKYNVLAILPLYMYEHSGVDLSTSDFGDRWDSGCIGFVFMTTEQGKEWEITEDKAEEQIKNGIEYWNKLNNDNMYSVEFFTVDKCKCCNHSTENSIDWINGLFSEDLEQEIIPYIGKDNIEE